MKFRTIFTAAIATVLAVTAISAANAVVTRLEDGSWFVGKGDVQSAFGWDAKTTDKQFNSVTFGYTKTVTTTYDCVTAQGAHGTYVATETSTQGTTRDTSYLTRSNGTQVITGATVILTGTPITSGSNSLTCQVGVVDNSSKSTVTESTLTAFSSMTGRKQVSSAVIWREVN